MQKRLFLNWINMYHARVTIRDGKEFSPDVDFCATPSTVAGQNHTFMGACAALDCVIDELSIEICFFYMGIC
jgi:hypothetical protein